MSWLMSRIFLIFKVVLMLILLFLSTWRFFFRRNLSFLVFWCCLSSTFLWISQNLLLRILIQPRPNPSRILIIHIILFKSRIINNPSIPISNSSSTRKHTFLLSINKRLNSILIRWSWLLTSPNRRILRPFPFPTSLNRRQSPMRNLSFEHRIARLTYYFERLDAPIWWNCIWAVFEGGNCIHKIFRRYNIFNKSSKNPVWMAW